MKPLRYDCDIEGLEGNWIEISAQWSQADMAAFFSTEDMELFGVVAKKVAALHLVTIEGEVLDSPDDYTVEKLQDVHIALFRWLSSVAVAAVGEVGTLGEENRRQLLRSPEERRNGQLTPS